MTDGALDGLRVLDLSQHVSGAYCGKLLAGYGADVVKVEPPEGDPTRRLGPFLAERPHPETGALFLYLNTSKKGITLNLDARGGVQVLHDLAHSVDVLIEDLEPGKLARRGAGYPNLAAVNPGLVYTSISPFGSDGPYAEWAATQLTLYAMGGYMYLTGDADREPLQGPGWQPSYLAGIHAVVGIMTALWIRESGLGGQLVEVSEMESVAACHQWTITRYNYSGTVQRRIGNRYDFGHPITIYPCRDGYVAIGVASEEQAERFFLLIDRPELLADERFNSNVARLANASTLDEIMGPWFLKRTEEEIVRQCQELRVPCSPVSEVDELLENEHYRARGFWRGLDHPVAGTLQHPAPPFRMTGSPDTVARAPLLGEHNQDVYGGWLGLTPEDLTSMREAGIL